MSRLNRGETKAIAMVMKNESSIQIDRSIDEVFDYTINHVAEWSHTVLEAIPIDTKPEGGVGSTFRCVTGDQGQTMEFHGTVTKHEPPLLSAAELIGKQFDIDVLYVFEDLNGSTNVTQVSVVTPKGFIMKALFAILGPFMNKANCKAADRELLSLKTKLERHQTANSQ